MATTGYLPDLCPHGLRDSCLTCFTDEMDRLRAENERLRSMLARVPVVSPCEVNTPPPRCGRCDACRELRALDDEVKAWDNDAA